MSTPQQTKEQIFDTIEGMDNISNDEQIEQNAVDVSRLRLLPEQAIPTPESLTKHFKKKFDNAKRIAEPFHKDWKGAFDEYGLNKTDQNGIEKSSDENFVKQIVETVTDKTYMQNPSGEFSALDPESDQMAKLLTNAVTNIVSKKTSPGINLRPKMLKLIMMSHFTNLGVMELKFQEKSGSYEEAFQLYAKLEAELMNKDHSDEKIAYIYNTMDQLVEHMRARATFGIGVSVTSPFDVYVDDACESEDLTDAKVVCVRRRINRNMFIAEYLVHPMNEETGVAETTKLVFKYNPERTFDQDATMNETQERKEASVKEEIVEALLSQYSEDKKKIILQDTVSCIEVYDKISKRRYLYLEHDWSEPVWVREEEMQLSRFFPFFILPFSPVISSLYQRSEVSNYIPFQRQINWINKQYERIRNTAFNIVFFDKSAVDPQEVKDVMSQVENANNKHEGFKVIGVSPNSRSNKTLSEMFESFKFPTANMGEIFDTSRERNALTAASRISEHYRGKSFVSHTTNNAIDFTQQQIEERNEPIIDRIEHVVEDIFWALGELVVSKFSKETLRPLVRQQTALSFQPMTVEQFNQEFALSVAAGSMQKATSAFKKEEGLRVIQMLGQFGTAAPRTVLTIVSNILRNIFSKSLVTDEDIEGLKNESEQQINMQQNAQQNPQQSIPQDAAQ